jgi:ZIP family zinc transporter
MASVLQHEQSEGNDDGDNNLESDMDIKDDVQEQEPLEENDMNEDPATEATTVDENETEKKRLEKMGMNTALAIGLHNFPEGLATFVAALNDPKVGTVLAVAIAIHNIPEGLCVALPIFYATGSRTRAFLWACLSGASEILAAFLGWLVLANVFSDVAYAVLFGLVAGMMVIISIRELVPTAHFYDPEDTVVTNSFIGGMVLIALSLVLFQI